MILLPSSKNQVKNQVKGGERRRESKREEGREEGRERERMGGGERGIEGSEAPFVSFQNWDALFHIKTGDPIYFLPFLN